MSGCYPWALIVLLAAPAWAAPPATRPAATQPHQTDEDLDALLRQGTQTEPPKPDLPASRPAAPFGEKNVFGYRKALVVFSDGEKFHGPLRTTLDKPIRVWVDEDKEYHDIPWALVKSFDAKIVWEREEAEWHFKESGSDIKEYTGKTYPAREMQYTLTLLNDQSITGGVVAPLYVQTLAGQEKTLVLHKRDKGQAGQTLKDLVYVKHVEFEE
jgi:hypothetical protein